MLKKRITNKTYFSLLSTRLCFAGLCETCGDATIRTMRRLPIALALLLLAACGGSSNSSSVAQCDQRYWDGTVGTCLPEGWHVVDTADLQSRGAPREVLVAFQADEAIAGRFPLITVTTQQLAQGLKPAEFDEQSRQSVKTLPGYTLVDERETEVDNLPYTLHIFSAQPIAEQPTQRFYQISVAGEGRGYTFTGVLPLTVSKEQEAGVLTLLSNVTLTETKEGE